MSIAFLACAERGVLEAQAVLLARSIRRYGGRFADAPVYTFQPREGTEVSNNTLAQLRELNVTHITETLNVAHRDYPIGNKIFVSAFTEETLSEDVLVFLDSDTILTGEPDAFDLEPETDAAARPVDRKNRGSAGTDDRNDGYWRRLYELCGVTGEPFVQTTVDRERIRAYFNAGLIVVRREAGLMRQWREDFARLMRAEHIPAGGVLNNMDQLALAATFARVFDRVSTLDWRYNYPLGKRPILPAPMRTAGLDELIHVHYHRWFQRPDFLRLTRPPLDRADERRRWLEDQLPLEPTIDTPLRYVDQA